MEMMSIKLRISYFTLGVAGIVLCGMASGIEWYEVGALLFLTALLSTCAALITSLGFVYDDSIIFPLGYFAPLLALIGQILVVNETLQGDTGSKIDIGVFFLSIMVWE